MFNLENLNQEQINLDSSQGAPNLYCFQSICDLLEDQAKKSPQSTALIFEGLKLSYFDLHEKSDALAHYLCRQGVKPGVVIGLSLPKNENLIIGILGIFKAGGVYLPLDPDYPKERLRYMIDDAKPAFLLTEAKIANRLPIQASCQTFLMDSDWEKTKNKESTNFSKAIEIQPDAPAYIIYTSGSTGNPKGIVVAHKSLPNVVQSRLNLYPKAPVALLIGSISFDPTLLTILYVLATGGTLCLPADESYSHLPNLIDLIQTYSVTFILCVTSFYSMLLERANALPTLEAIFVGGEALPSALPPLHARIASKAYLFNEYGPAEHAIGGTIATIYDPVQKQIFPIHIGKPLPNVQIHILDEELKEVPSGGEGEIFIGGIGLAKGYLNRPELTAQKFFSVTLKDKKAVRLYRTGDWGCFLTDGNAQFLGRIDHQVKIWGHRVELAEIETVLSQHSEVHEAVVVVQEKDSKRLIGFYSTQTDKDIKEELRVHLSRFLPNHMVPPVLFKIGRWPKTPNGKIDRAKLLSLLDEQAPLSNNANLTIEQTQASLLNIWEAVLKKETIEAHENFFDLGGDSIQVSHVQALIEEKFNLSLDLVTLFQFPNLPELAAHIHEIQIKSLPKNPGDCVAK